MTTENSTNETTNPVPGTAGAPQSAPVGAEVKPEDLMAEKNGAQETSASQFKKDAAERSEGRLITLSSGHTIKITRPSVNNLVKTGQLPSELANAAIKMQSGQGQITDTDMKKYVEYNERLVKLSVVSPKIVDNPNYDDNQIGIEDLSDDERSEILIYVNGGLDALAKFRSAGQGVSAGPDMQ